MSLNEGADRCQNRQSNDNEYSKAGGRSSASTDFAANLIAGNAIETGGNYVHLLAPGPRAETSVDTEGTSVDLILENRRLRRRFMFSKVVAVAASIVAVASLVTLLTVRNSSKYIATVSASPASATIAMVSPDSSNSQMGTLIAEPRGWGSQLVLTMQGLAPGKVYKIVVVSGSKSEVAGDYAVPSSGTLHVIAASSVWANKISGVRIVANDGKTYSRSAS